MHVSIRASRGPRGDTLDPRQRENLVSSPANTTFTRGGKTENAGIFETHGVLWKDKSAV